MNNTTDRKQNEEKNNKQKNFVYKDTLNLPITNFPMKANLINEEPKILALWEKIDLYNALQDLHKNDPIFVFQDGPPYANGNIHLGHAFNKILKDFVVKTKNLSGYRVPFVPGWDCHGLPIEIQVEKKLNKQSHQLNPTTFINKCREYATQQINNQRQQFIRLGIICDWQRPYITMDFKFEAAVIRTLGKILANGHITRGDRPVHWCLNCSSALAEAEVEYKDKLSPSIYVAFKCKDLKLILSKFNLNLHDIPSNLHNVEILIWTTTPWTLPANQAVALNPIFTYCLLYSQKLNRAFIVAKNLAPELGSILDLDDYKIIAECNGDQLENLRLQHPLYDKLVPSIFSNHVTLDAGTGCVHIAPAHGLEDYLVGKKYNLPVENFIDNRGCFLPNTVLFANLHINKAISEIIKILQEQQVLIKHTEISHSYAHCWRHKTPIIYMATPQWFISMEKHGLRDKALKAITEVTWFPSWGQARIEGMMQKDRPDWCISRQRVWGVPIPFWIHKETNELHPQQLELLEKIAQLVEQHGIEAWHNLDIQEFLGNDFDKYVKSKDMLDVWFESGAVSCCITDTHPEMQNHADLYLEGSDQHRGWFQSSLLVSIAVNGNPPYKQVLTHGFILDAEGNKMSKSLGNIVSPQDIVNKYGADLLRLWVATTDYSGDLKISEEILKRVSDAYRRIRNTTRFLLANLNDFDANRDLISTDQMLLLDCKMLDITVKLQAEILQYYAEYRYHLAYQKILNFCVEELGSFYLDIIKDRQYTCKTNSIPRRSVQTTLYYILEALVRWVAPILSFTAEEIWQHMPNRETPSVFLSSWYNNWPKLININLENQEFWSVIFSVKKEVNKQIELARNSGIIGSNLEAEITINCDPKIYKILNSLQPELKFLLITSTVKLETSSEHNLLINVTNSKHSKCERCWHREVTVDENGLCKRCKINTTTMEGELRKYA